MHLCWTFTLRSWSWFMYYCAGVCVKYVTEESTWSDHHKNNVRILTHLPCTPQQKYQIRVYTYEGPDVNTNKESPLPKYFGKTYNIVYKKAWIMSIYALNIKLFPWHWRISSTSPFRNRRIITQSPFSHSRILTNFSLIS